MERTAARDVFEHAARYEPELTNRQREVLRLIALGKTNTEIGEALGMSLAGAKWHVSELLTKLGLESREAAAEFYRWRQAPSRKILRRVQGLVAGAGVRLGLATAGGVAAAGLGVAVLFALNGGDVDPGPAVPGLPFYMETVFTREEAEYAYQATNRYWFQDESHQRVERGRPEVTRGQGNVDFGSTPTTAPAVIRDGVTEWHPGPLYRGRPLGELLAIRQSIPGTGVGPLKYPSVEDWLTEMAKTGGESELPSLYELETTKSVLGRRVEVYARRYLTQHPDAASPGDRRVWIDRERLFVVRTELTMVTPEGEEVIESEAATKLVYGESQPTGLFVFTPEPGWVENRCEASQARPPLEPPSPFLAVPREAIPGTDSTFRMFGGSVAPDGTCDAWRHEYGSIGDQSAAAVLFVRQEARHLESVFSSGRWEAVDVGWIEVRLGDADNGGRSIAWMGAEVSVEVRSTQLSDDELVAFARMMVESNR